MIRRRCIALQAASGFLSSDTCDPPQVICSTKYVSLLSSFFKNKLWYCHIIQGGGRKILLPYSKLFTEAKMIY